MPAERHAPNDPREWLNRARSSLLRARMQASGVYLEDLCFDAQQATEKAIKAVLIHRGVRFPYVHDLGRLLGLLDEAGVAVPADVARAAELSGYAVESRYPGLGEPVSAEEYQRAVTIAESVLRWAEERTAKSP